MADFCNTVTTNAVTLWPLLLSVTLPSPASLSQADAAPAQAMANEIDSNMVLYMLQRLRSQLLPSVAATVPAGADGSEELEGLQTGTVELDILVWCTSSVFALVHEPAPSCRASVRV